jgi:glucose-6-phosphate 1-epimerase
MSPPSSSSSMMMPTCTKFTAEEDDCVSSSHKNLSGGVVLDNTKFTCKIYNFGAHVVSWRSKSDLEVYKTKPEFLFLSEKAILDGTKAIRGGIPICFPQFGKLGGCTNQHGFARNATWDFVDSEVDAARAMAKATFTTSSTEETLKEFPYKFTLKYTVTIEKEFLNTRLEVINTDEKEFEFTTALHTYFGVKSVADVAVKGLNGTRYTDSLEDGKKCLEGEEEIRFDKEVDRIYRRNVALVEEQRLEIIDRVWEEEGVLSQHTRGVAMSTKNLNDAVVWNPWIDKAKSMADFGDEEYKEMVCVEAAAIDEPVKVKPGESWIGEQTLESVINLAHFSV